MYHKLFAYTVDDFMVLSCVICITLMVFIYVYYGLFTCINLVDVMSLFFTGFSLYLPIFNKNRPVSGTNRLKIAYRPNRPIYRCSRFHCSSVVFGAFRLNFFDFHRLLPNFSKTNIIHDIRFSWFRRIFEH
jgi:hypothetical protein